MTYVKVEFSRDNGKIKPMHATNNIVIVPRNGASDWNGTMEQYFELYKIDTT